jgi:muramidase (phage lysozyme)
MDKSVPAGAAKLLNFIGRIEVGTDGRSGYDVVFAQRQKKLAQLKKLPITRRTVDEWIATMPWWGGQSSASGRYQFMKATLTGLKKELKLRGSQVMDADLQDRLGYHLLKRRGFEKFIAGKMTATAFGKALAQEWASLPVLAGTRGKHGNVIRGQSYYSGDKFNRALVSPERVEAILADVLRASSASSAQSTAPAPDSPAPLPPEPPKTIPQSKTLWVALAGFLATAGGALTDWRVATVICVFITLVAFLFIGRERIRKIVDHGV